MDQERNSLSLSFQILSWMMSWQQTQFRPFYLDHEKSLVAPQLRVIFTSGKHAEGSNPFSLCSAVVSDSCRGLRHIKLQFVLSKSEGGTKKTPNKTKTCCCPWCETRGVRLLSTSAHKRERNPKRKPRHFQNAPNVVPLCRYVMEGRGSPLVVPLRSC